MEETSNERKNRLLGEPHGTATSKLRKILLFELAIKLNLHICFRCSTPIETLRQFSIEHTEPWQGAVNPKETFFDTSKIAFSHLSCNVAAGNGSKRVYPSNKERYKAEHLRVKSNPIRYEKKLSGKRV